MTDDLFLWTLYFNPSDFPGLFVARKFSVKLNAPTEDFFTGLTAETVYQQVQNASPYVLDFIYRNPQDDPVIIGTWM